MSQLQISAAQHGSAIVLTLQGPLDSVTSTELNTSISSLIEQGHRQLIIEASGMTMITSAGIGELVGAFNDLEDHGGELRLVALPEQASRAMAQLHLLDMFEVLPDVAGAVASF